MRGKLRALSMIGAAGAALASVGVVNTPAVAVRGTGPARPEVIGYVTESGTSKLDRLDPVTDRLMPPITVGRAPTTMAVAPGGKIAYVVSTDSTVWAVSLLTGKARAVTGIGPNPRQVAFSADGRTAYVATDSDLVAVDVASGHVITTLAVTNFPLGPVLAVAPHGHALFMIDPNTSVTQVNTATNTVTGQLPIAACGAGAFSPDGHYLYLPVTRGVVAVNTVTGTAGSPVPGGGCASGLLLTNNGRTLYSTGLRARGRTTVTKFAVSAASLSPLWSTVVDQQADGVVMALNSGGSTLFVGRVSHESITPVNTATGKAGRVIADGLDNRQLTLGPSGRFLLAANTFRPGVAVISTATMRLVRTVRTGGFRVGGLVASPDRSQVFALVIPAGNAHGWLVPISAASGTAGRRILLDGRPTGLVFAR